MEQKPNQSLTVLGRAKMSYPDPKIVEEMRKRGIERPNPRLAMGRPLQ